MMHDVRMDHFSLTSHFSPAELSAAIEANKRDVPYQSLIKMTLADQFRPPVGS